MVERLFGRSTVDRLTRLLQATLPIIMFKRQHAGSIQQNDIAARALVGSAQYFAHDLRVFLRLAANHLIETGLGQA
jgi:hypothetical protein